MPQAVCAVDLPGLVGSSIASLVRSAPGMPPPVAPPVAPPRTDSHSAAVHGPRSMPTHSVHSMTFKSRGSATRVAYDPTSSSDQRCPVHSTYRTAPDPTAKPTIVRGGLHGNAHLLTPTCAAPLGRTWMAHAPRSAYLDEAPRRVGSRVEARWARGRTRMAAEIGEGVDLDEDEEEERDVGVHAWECRKGAVTQRAAGWKRLRAVAAVT